MKFPGNVAVITGGADGMGKALAMRLVCANCSVAICDIFPEKLAAARRELEAAARAAGNSAVVSTHICDVSIEQQCLEFASAVAANHMLSGRGLLLFNNAGVSLAGSMIADSRANWEKTFNICWGGVYLMTRAFMPLLLASPEGYVINTSSVNGFWASIGFLRPHTSYVAAKFAVKGFTEALIDDFRLNAPHLKAFCVMPGHIGTGIAENSGSVRGGTDADAVRDQAVKFNLRLQEMKDRGDPAFQEIEEDALWRPRVSMSKAIPKMSNEELSKVSAMGAQEFRRGGITSLQAADIILAGIQKDQWRILVGDDAIMLDKLVRERPVEVLESPVLAMKTMSTLHTAPDNLAQTSAPAGNSRL